MRKVPSELVVVRSNSNRHYSCALRAIADAAGFGRPDSSRGSAIGLAVRGLLEEYWPRRVGRGCR